MSSQSRIESSPFKMHPSVFQALGSELTVTSDVLAVIDLVKNSFNASATRVDVRFGTDAKATLKLEIDDNGVGMGQEKIDDVRCTVATPFHEQNLKSKDTNLGPYEIRPLVGTGGAR